MMWKYLVVQSLVFFVFFQPRLLSSRRYRRPLLVLCLGLSIWGSWATRMDPFASLLYLAGIGLTYWTANKALRWVFSHRARSARETIKLSRSEEETRGLTDEKQDDIRRIQREILQVSDIYENVKEMSGSLNHLDIFVHMAEALIKNFSIHKARIILFKKVPQQRHMIDKIYYVDDARLKMRASSKSMMTDEVLFQGETYPIDIRLVDILNQNPKPLYFTEKEGWDGPAQTGEAKALGGNSLMAIPVRPQKDMAAIITLEGLKRKDLDSISILTERFQSEFKRIDLYHHVQRMATTDYLTGVYVRRYFFGRLKEEIGRCERFNLKFSFLMIDIDNFKSYNDRFGHLVGDGVLKQTAAIIKQTVREVDLVGRFGGEEFAAILLDTDAENAMYVGQRIRRNIENNYFKVYDENMSLTVSVGVATYNANITEGSQIVEWADSALYQAKRQGKNRVCAYLSSS